MNEKLFDLFMNNVDDSLLEEAMDPNALPGKSSIYRYLRPTIAACLCIGLLAAFFHMHQAPGSSALTSQDLAALGYDLTSPLESLPLDLDMETVSYSMEYIGAANDIRVAQATFTSDGTEYTCRAYKTDTPQDISGIDTSSDDGLTLTADNTAISLVRSDSGDSYVSWYSPETETQWCLSAREDSATVMTTAYYMLMCLGVELTDVPAGADNISCNIVSVSGLTVGELNFTLDGTHYTYHTAPTSEVAYPFADISGDTKTYTSHITTKIGWCTAELYLSEDGSGKVIWFDIAPGLLYSLTMDRDADEEALLSMAEQIYTPVQGE